MDNGEGGYPGVADHADLAYEGLGDKFPHIAGPSAQPLVYATLYAILTGVVTHFTSFHLFCYVFLLVLGLLEIF